MIYRRGGTNISVFPKRVPYEQNYQIVNSQLTNDIHFTAKSLAIAAYIKFLIDYANQLVE